MEKRYGRRSTATTRKSADNVRINLEHIVKRHMPPVPKDTSYFLSNEVQEIYAIIKNAYRRPDKYFPHRRKSHRFVFQKKFRKQLGVHGISKAPCYCVTGIFDLRSNDIITAYPTV